MGKIYKNGILFAGSTDNASAISFNNADTGIEATNVQGAIEEIKDDVAEINRNSIPKEISITGEHVHSAAYAYQIGHEVIANIYFNNLTLTANTFLEIGTIEVPPLKASNFVCVFINVSNNKVLGYGNLQINTSGILSVRSDIDITQGRCAANVVYVCN